MKLDNIHQPYIFRNGQYFNILITEYQPIKYEYKIKKRSYKEDIWKIKSVDENLEIHEVKTPKELINNGVKYFVFSECSPFIYDSKMSFVATCYTTEFGGMVNYFLVQGDYIYETKEVINFSILGNYYSAIAKNEEIIYVDKRDNKIKSTHNFIPKSNNFLDDIIRVMGIEDSNDLLITGVKDDYYRTILWKYGTEDFFMLKTSSDKSGIYKSSIYGDIEEGVLVYTDKELPDNETKKYKLNIDLGYKLEKI